MNINEIKQAARERMNQECVLCKECNGVYCAGKVPGMGGAGSGRSMKRNFEQLSMVKLNLKTIHSAKDPDTSCMLWGNELSSPILTAPITGAVINMGGNITEQQYCFSAVIGSKNAGTIAMIGDSADPQFYTIGLDEIKASGAKGIAIIKPRENKKIIENIKKAEQAGVIAVGIDIDGAGLVTMALSGQPVGPKTKEELREIISSTDLPVILKGIMSVEEALLAVEVGARAIVVSNHGGRVLDDALSSIEVLKDIADSVRGKIVIMADGAVRDGKDAFKYIAAGADFVLTGRPVIWAAVAGRENAVTDYLKFMRDDLYKTMILTGAADISSIDHKMIKYPF